MLMAEWSDDALAAAATPAGSVMACAKMGKPPSQAAGLRQAAVVELARRRAKLAPRRGVAPVSVRRRASGLTILSELWDDPLIQGTLRAVLALIRIGGSRRTARAVLVQAGAPKLVGPDLDTIESIDGMKEFERSIERMRAHVEAVELARVELPYPFPYRHLIADLVEYADDKLLPGGRPAFARPNDPAVSLPRTALAVLNAGSIENVTEWRNELARKKYQGIPRRNLLLKLHREGIAILAEHSPFLGYPEPGPPRGVWPPPPAIERRAPPLGKSARRPKTDDVPKPPFGG